MTSAYVAGGYLLRKTTSDPHYGSREVLTISHCVSDCLPSVTHLHAKSSATDEERVTELTKFGINPAVLPELVEWVSSASDRRELEWPHVFTSPDLARTFVNRFHIPTSNLDLLGIGLGSDYVRRFLQEEKEEPSISANGFYTMIERGQSMTPGGTIVGFDVLGGEYWPWPHYWDCYDTGAKQELSIKPNAFGLLDTFEAAEKATHHINNLEPPAGMGSWYPWIVVKYPVTSRKV